MPKRPRLDGHSHLMSDHEWDHFWARVAWIDEDEDDEMGGGSRDSYTVYVPSPRAMPSALWFDARASSRPIQTRTQFTRERCIPRTFACTRD